MAPIGYLETAPSPAQPGLLPLSAMRHSLADTLSVGTSIILRPRRVVSRCQLGKDWAARAEIPSLTNATGQRVTGITEPATDVICQHPCSRLVGHRSQSKDVQGQMSPDKLETWYPISNGRMTPAWLSGLRVGAGLHRACRPGQRGVSSCSSASGGNSTGPGGCSEASLRSSGRRRARGRWNERRLCTRLAAADRACAPGPGVRMDCTGLTGGNGAGRGGCGAAGGSRCGDKLPVSGVSEPVSPVRITQHEGEAPRSRGSLQCPGTCCKRSSCFVNRRRHWREASENQKSRDSRKDSSGRPTWGHTVLKSQCPGSRCATVMVQAHGLLPASSSPKNSFTHLKWAWNLTPTNLQH